MSRRLPLLVSWDAAAELIMGGAGVF